MATTKLTSSVTIRQYRTFKAKKDRDSIADLIFKRFYERYIEPFKNNPSKHGFSMMAVGCLMIEALFCFKEGRKKTGEAGGVVFERFFSESSALTVFSGYGDAFYSNVRCGILHQGETYGGWKILRKGVLFDKTIYTINATKFLDAMERELQTYATFLKGAPFNSKPWKNVIRKLDYICKNCNA